MRKLLTALAATSLIGSLFLAAPAPVAAAEATDSKVEASHTDVIHYDVSRDTAGKFQTYLAPASSVLDMTITMYEGGLDGDLQDTVTLSLKNGSLAGTYGDSSGYPGFDGGDTNPYACTLDWNETNEAAAPTASLTAAVDCNAGDGPGIGDGADGAADHTVTLSFTVTLPAGGSSVLTVSGVGDSYKVYFFAAEAADDIYVGSGSLPAAAGDGNCTNPDFSTDPAAQGTMDEALFAALSAVDDVNDTIIICNGTYTYIDDIELYSGIEQYDATIHIEEAPSATVKLDGVDDWSLLNASGVDLDITGIEFEDGELSSGGGVNLESGDLTLTDTIFDSNEALGFYGGAVRVSSGDVHVVNSTFTGNRANQDGGAIHIGVDGDMTVTGSTFTDNGAYNDDGGAISVANGGVTIEESEFIDNFCQDFGGAIYSFNGDVIVTSSNFEDNYSDNEGGAIANKTPEDTGIYVMSIEDSTFDDNEADDRGGAVFSDHDTLLEVDDSVFTDNSSSGYGGAVFARDDATIGFSVFLRNESSNAEGGAVYFDEHAKIHDSRFVDNYAYDEGGAVYAETMTYVDDTVFLRNRSLSWAGALSLAGNAWLDGAIFRANKSRRGGAIDSWGDRLHLVESRFINNRATRDGGAIIRDGETLFGDVGPDTIFRGNQARLGDAVAIYRWKEVNGGPGREVARTWSRVWVAAGTTVWLVR